MVIGGRNATEQSINIEAAGSHLATTKEDKIMMTNAFTFNGNEYSRNENGYCYKFNSDKKVRISKAEFEQAYNDAKAEAEKAKKADTKKSRKSKDVAFTYSENGVAIVTLTAKQVEFIQHIPDTNFYENGLESTPWIDVLADEIGGQFAGKPMTVGAMISTIREKGLIEVDVMKVNGKKAKFFVFTELGKDIARALGLN